MVKENLLKFDATPLFPERIAYTVPYMLSDAEAHLYKEVTDYVREEFNRAEALENDKRSGTVGFALTILQRRLVSSPEAIYQSLRRRRERLESRLRELEVLHRGGAVAPVSTSSAPTLDPEDVGRANLTPRSFARFLPSPVRARIISRSNSAKPPRTVSINRPCGLVVSAQDRASPWIARDRPCQPWLPDGCWCLTRRVRKLHDLASAIVIFQFGDNTRCNTQYPLS